MSATSSDNFNLSERGRLRYEAFLQLQVNEGRQTVPSSDSERDSEPEPELELELEPEPEPEMARARAHAQAQAQALAQTLSNKFPKTLHAPEKILPKLTQLTHIRDIFKKNGKLVRSVSFPGRSDSSTSLPSSSSPSASTSGSAFVSASNLPAPAYPTDPEATEATHDTDPHQKHIVRRKTTQSSRSKSASKDKVDNPDKPSVSKRHKKNSSARRSRSRKTSTTPNGSQYSEETRSYAMTVFLNSLCSTADDLIENSLPSLRPYRKHVKVTLIITALVLCHYTIDMFILLLSMHIQ